MKYNTIKFLLIGFFIWNSIENTNAQDYAQLIQSFLNKNQESKGHSLSDVNDWIISDSYFDNSTGLNFTYVNQRFNNIIVFNAISVFAIKNNTVVNYTPDFINDVSKKTKSLFPGISPEDAIYFAIQNINGGQISSPQIIGQDEELNLYNFELPEISRNPVTVQLVYQPVEDELILAWNVSIEMKNTTDWWNVRIDALTGEFIEKNNFIVEDNFGFSDDEINQGSNHQSIQNSVVPTSQSSSGSGPVYNVFPFPYEAPTFGSRQLVIDPADPVASPYGWHDVNGAPGAEYTITNGNNVYAAVDADANNQPDYSPDGGAELDFNYNLNFSTFPYDNKEASVTNLFYINNRMHDILYRFGFNEVAGNFQMNNYGNGGLGNDQVIADALDGSGLNNANFGTPPDGSSPRMQMYLWNGNPFQYDASFDNGIIAHEYGHGLSNRLTGGPANSNCLNNAEQGGEGWSDYLALMMTIEKGDVASDARGIGTYVRAQSNTGLGIRRRPYSISMGVNPLTYENLGNSGSSSGIAKSTAVHSIGEIWCSALWDMSWYLMEEFGFDETWTNTSSGNYIALNLVIQGMKLQPCSPGFLDARDAILSADNLLYGGVHTCKIWQAFARRGMGIDALQGSSNNAADQTVGFLLPPSCETIPLAVFQSHVSSMSCNNTFYFIDLSQRAYSYYWDFGDGDFSTLPNPSHTYTISGTYTVTLTVTNPAGSNSVSHTLISITNPTSAFSIVDTTVYTGEIVVFKNQSKEVCSYFMDFGDNTSSPEFISNHTYNTPGDYNVKLVATNLLSKDSVFHTVHVVAPFIKADFSPDKNPATCGYTVSFTNISIQSTSWLWDFGDQTTSTDQNPLHQYPFAGTYSVKLISKNNLESDTAIKTIVIQPAFTIAATAAPVSICQGNSTQLYVVNSTTSNEQYSLNNIAYAPVAGSGTEIVLADDQLSGFLPIGFTFKYDGVDNTQFKVCSNGYVTFNSSASALVSAVSQIPNLASPNNMVAMVWSDLYPPYPGSSINYFTTGVAPSRKLVINFNTVFYDDNTKHAIFQSVFYEGSNVIEFHFDTVNVPVGRQAVQGIENRTGSAGISIPGRNKSNIKINDEGWRFTPHNFSYTWSPGNSIGFSAKVFPTETVIYTVTVGDGSGCLASYTTPQINVNNANPVISGNIPICNNGSILLDAGPGFTSYVWSTGATTQKISVNSAETFSVTVNDAFGCSGSSSVTTTLNPNVSPIILGDMSICEGSSTFLDAGTFSGYSWSTGETTKKISVNTTGTFSVTVTNANGCTGSTEALITLKESPTANISGELSFCDGSFTELCGNAEASSYLWSNGATSECITVTDANSYTVTITSELGCTASTSVTSILKANPGINIIGSTSFCEGSNTQLCGSAGAESYLWNNGSTSQCITVNDASVYYLSVTNVSGCTTNASVATAINSNPQPSISGNLSICQGSTTSLDAGKYFSYLWSNDATTETISTNTAETFAVVVTDSKGCTGSSSVTTILAANPTSSISGNLSFCGGTSTILNAGEHTGYLWSTGATSQTIPVNTAGEFSVIVTDANGCTGASQVNTILNASPTAIINGNLSFCNGSSTQLCGNAGVSSYLWSNGLTSQCITINNSNTYSVIVTNELGCTASASAITTLKSNPQPSITGGLSICQGSSTILDAGKYYSYHWSNDATSDAIIVNTAGTYSVIVTDFFGCTGSASVNTILKASPITSITGNLSFCGGTNTTLDAGSHAGYLWSTGSSAQTISVNTAGNFSVTVTDANGCTGSTQSTTTLKANPTASISGSLSFCDGNSTLLCGIGGVPAYLWSNGAISQCINITNGGLYSVTVTNAEGCSASSSVTTTKKSKPTPTITGNSSLCQGSSISLSTGNYSSYLWSTNASTQAISVNNAGTFSVTVTDAGGCTASASKVISVNPLPVATAGNNNPQCSGTLNLTSSGGTSYSWKGPNAYTSLLQNPVITNTTTLNSGIYTVTVTNANGCTASATTTVTIGSFSNSNGTVTGLASVCVNQTGVVYCVTNPNPQATSFIWTLPTGVIASGFTNRSCITLRFTSSFKGGNICSKAVTPCGNTINACLNVVLVSSTPAIPGTMSGPTSLCRNATATYSVAAVPNTSSYSWSFTGYMQIMSGQGGTSVVVKALSNFSGGSVRVRSVNCYSSSSLRTKNVARSFSCREATSINNEEVEAGSEILSEVSAYPNPTSGKITVSFYSEIKSKVTVKVLDVLGKSILMDVVNIVEGENTNEMDLGFAAKGMYFLMIESEGREVQCLRIVVE